MLIISELTRSQSKVTVKLPVHASISALLRRVYHAPCISRPWPWFILKRSIICLSRFLRFNQLLKVSQALIHHYIDCQDEIDTTSISDLWINLGESLSIRADAVVLRVCQWSFDLMYQVLLLSASRIRTTNVPTFEIKPVIVHQASEGWLGPYPHWSRSILILWTHAPVLSMLSWCLWWCAFEVMI